MIATGPKNKEMPGDMDELPVAHAEVVHTVLPMQPIANGLPSLESVYGSTEEQQQQLQPAALSHAAWQPATKPVSLEWTPHEDAILLEAARQTQGIRGHHDWDLVSRLLMSGGVFGRTALACRTRFQESAVRNARDIVSQGMDWSPQGKEALWNICQQFLGHVNWRMVEQQMHAQNFRGRTSEMCRHQLRRIKKGRVNKNPKKQMCGKCGLPRAGHFCRAPLLDAAAAPALTAS